jgi:hypothetical protein
MPSANYGAGEPRFMFYPPLTWMLGAALLKFLGWGALTIWMVYLPLAATGLATRALAREVLNDSAATLAGCAAIFSGYALFTAYERSAFGELTGGFWIPLLLLFALRDHNVGGSSLRRALDGSAAALALTMAGAWLSNVPLGIMASYLLAAVALVAGASRRSLAPVIRAAAGAGLGIALAGFFLVPAVREQRWVDVAQATSDPGSRIENSWLFARHADPGLDLHDTVLLKASAIAATMIAVALAGLAVVWMRGRLKQRREWWMVLAIIPLVVLVLQLPISLPIWNLLPKLRLLQFPWRWLVVLEAPMAILFAAAIWPAKRWWRIAVTAACAVLFWTATSAAALFFHQKCDPEDTVSGVWRTYASGAGFDGDDEYEPPGADDSALPTGLPGACLVTQPKAVLAAASPDTNPTWDPGDHTCVAIYAAKWVAPERLSVSGAVPKAGYLVLRLRVYPAWRITVNGRGTPSFDQREDGLMAVPVAEGPVDVEVGWKTTRAALAGKWVSGVALLLLVAMGVVEWRLRRPQVHLS